MSAVVELKNTPLLDEHIALGAKMVGFAGWNMPLQYEGILQEFIYNRKTASLFDCSHMGEFFVDGSLDASGLNGLVTQPLQDMPSKTCRYGVMLNSDGGILDDLIVYKISDERWMIVVNASNIDKDRRHLQENLNKNVRFSDVSLQTAKLDLQGPLSRQVLSRWVPNVNHLQYYAFDEFDLLGEKVIISRTGYTGELGFEIYCPWSKAKEIWKAILANDNVKPTGLGIRDVLRIEMCYPLYGHELDETISPLEAGLKKFIDFNKDFIGKSALLKQQAKSSGRKTIYFVSDSRRAPRFQHKIFTDQGQQAGIVTSGTFSPALEKGVGIALVDQDFKPGENILFGDDKSKNPAVIATRPFYKNGSIKN